MILQVEKLFDDQIRPALAQHGGNVEIIDIDNQKLFIKFHGGCHGCSSSNATLKGGIETLIKQTFPDILEVIDLTDHTNGSNPYMT
ncbi:MAG: NifU family protein [Proteobacteria bacterium]|jgi:Fe-S cluster biogenesis protein NfuA|nr:NifU family protein [Pseudomonadota bacterium]